MKNTLPSKISSFASKHIFVTVGVSLLAGAVIVGVGTVFLGNDVKNLNTVADQKPISGGEAKSSDVTPANELSTSPSSSSSTNAGQNVVKQSTGSSSGPTSTNPGGQAFPQPASPITVSFFDGTITPQLYTNQGDNHVSEWRNYSSTFDASKHQKLHFTWFISSQSSFSLQASNDKSTWVYIKQGQGNGTYDTITSAPYYRVYLDSGSCLPGYCENTPPGALTATIKGYFSN